MSNDTGLVVGLILGGLLLQYMFAWRQARVFARDVKQLRLSCGLDAKVSVGIGRRRGKRVYVALATGDGVHVGGALLLSGMTVFSGAQPFARLAARRLAELTEPEVLTGMSTAAANATAQAAQFLIAQVDRDGASMSGPPTSGVRTS